MRLARRFALPMKHMKAPFKPRPARPHVNAGDAMQRSAKFSTNRPPRRADVQDPRQAQRNYETYLDLARAETLKGDPIAAENYFQHAEHYFRTMRAGAN
jgi:hypothetical protein